VNEDGSFTV